MTPPLVALVLAALLVACGGVDEPAPAPARGELVGTADMERLLVSTQKRKSPKLRVGAAKVRVVEVGASIACTITLGEAVQKVDAVVKDLKGTVVVRG